MLVRPDGAQGFPYVGGNAVAEFPAIIQHQVIQQSVTDIEVRLVTRAQLSMEDEALLRGKMLAAIGHPFRIDFVYCDAIERSASGKYVEFRCEVAR